MLSKYLFLKYRIIYKLFGESLFKLIENSASKNLNNYFINCVNCKEKINNAFYDFKNNSENINEINTNYNLCGKCLFNFVEYVNSNLITKFLSDFRPKKEEKRKETISIEYIKLIDENGEEIKENSEYPIIYNLCKNEISFNLTFKYLDSTEGRIKNLLLYKSDGSGYVKVDNFSENNHNEMKVNFKFRNLNLKYIGEYIRQIYVCRIEFT